MIEVDGKYHVWIDRVGHGPVKMLTLITEGSHLEMYDDQERYFRELVRFIKDVESGKFK